MRYMLLICADDDVEAHHPGDGDRDASDWVEEMDRRGVRSMGERLAPPKMRPRCASATASCC